MKGFALLIRDLFNKKASWVKVRGRTMKKLMNGMQPHIKFPSEGKGKFEFIS